MNFDHGKDLPATTRPRGANKAKATRFFKGNIAFKKQKKKNPQSKIKKENNFSIKVAKREAKSKQPSTRNYF